MRTLKYIIGISLAVGLVACDDFLVETPQTAFEKEGMKIEVRDSLTNHYWIMGTPNRGDDVYDLLQDKDSLLQSKTDVNKQMLENPSRLLLINSNHEINAIDVEDNVSLVNLITKNWTELKLPWKPKNKELIWAWDKDSSCRRVLLFYDAKNNCCFSVPAFINIGVAGIKSKFFMAS